jgi:hypothetical protein
LVSLLSFGLGLVGSGNTPVFCAVGGSPFFLSLVLGWRGDLPFWDFVFKDIKKASAVLAERLAPAAELVFFMSLNTKSQKGRPS